jgi:hypothetical protein
MTSGAAGSYEPAVLLDTASQSLYEMRLIPAHRQNPVE